MITKQGCYSAKRLDLKRAVIGHHVARLQAEAARSLERVNKSYVGHSRRRNAIAIISSFRSCATQRRVCGAMPGCSPNGCPGRCAEPGRSYHQLGLAVDVAPPIRLRDRRAVRRAFYRAGWHNFSSNDSLSATGSDPWHFSYRVTG